MSNLKDFQTALERLEDVLRQPDSEYIRDASIQRFEFCFELGWKAVQTRARECGTDVASPRTALAFACRNGWIDDEAAWIEMLKARNLTVHTYHQDTAAAVFSKLPCFSQMLRTLIEKLRQVGDPT
jgi:nucleotidyltransferase substrate binding protein (TIGR01987 family)